MSLSIEPRQIDLWYVLLDKASDPALLDRYRDLLAADELARERRFLAEKARLQYLVGRALMRTSLSHYTGTDPRAWRFSYNLHGKPSLLSPVTRPLEFNLSHTEGLAVFAVTPEAEIGVDVEPLHRQPNALELAQRFFAGAEAAVLEALPPERIPERFFQFWTLKEAFIKALGTGLAMPLDQFAFTLAAGSPPRITFFGETRENASRWQFAQLRLAPSYQIALAVRMPEEERFLIRVWETVPLLWRSEGRVLPDHAANWWEL